jgi:GT2 family glycosyltransferase
MPISGRQNSTKQIIVGREISGVDRGDDGLYDMTFGGFYKKTDYVGIPSCKAAVYPVDFFEHALWNEDIYFGYEDADLSLQAKKNGFTFIYDHTIVVADEEAGVSTLNQQGSNETERWIWAARIHVGLKRYVYYRPNIALAVLFGLYVLAKLSVHAIKRRDIGLIPDVISRSKLSRLRSSPWRPGRGVGSALAVGRP